MERLLVFYNKSSGKDEGERLVRWFWDYVKERQPRLYVKLVETGPSVDDAELVRKAEAVEADILVIIGGDGTIHHIVQAFQKTLSQYHVGLFLDGAVNNLAHILEIPLKKEETADVILESNVRKIDCGQVNDKVIISTLTIGILADTAVWIGQEEKQRHGSWVFIKKFFELLLKKKKYHLGLETGEEHWKGKSQLLTVTMPSSVGGSTNFDDSATLDDGRFHVTIVPSLNIFRFIFYLPRVMRGKFHTIPGTTYFTAKRMKIRAQEKSVGTRTGGDTTDDLSAELSVVSKGLTVYSPKKEEKA